jgi:hypothetical protein
MNEGDTCEECGNMYEGNTQELGDNDEEEGFPEWEKLKKQMDDRNSYRNKNNRIDSEDFKLLRRGNKSNNNESVVSMYELHLDESTGEKFIFNENPFEFCKRRKNNVGSIQYYG